MNTATPLPRLENLLPPDQAKEKQQLLDGLMQSQASINPKFFYDEIGCQLFTRLCELEEYYPTRTEAGILRHYAGEISAALRPQAQWVDLGCGDCSKTRSWLQHFSPSRVIGVDIAGDYIRACLANIADGYPDLECVGVISDFTRRLDLKDLLAEDADSPPVFFYPGSSIGNFDRNQALRLLRRILEHCGQRGQLLIGADLVKPLPVMEAAYNDSQGLTAAFNLNVLRVVNRLLQADFNPDAFEHSAVYDARNSRIEMRLIATRPQTVRLGSSAVRQFRRGEYIITEHSHKYTPAGFGLLLAEAGFPRQQMWTDARGWFGIFLAEPDA
ncbi:L-histidine N(alpha)-methyltransferase [Halopseudomonas formosensis]|uniref:L-histidine N(Alpha)-methyltransferase n=1 Tax=Halopseudomonas formosensis TaxID=1002526 RepID=A0ABU5BZC8_9GAMM|nr:L-histidine N(alpha)-methyltransferase [Halopseudomonas formosensis]MDX9688135.1 L-histidine N(alpha)-methyltransferase [Halopseudomonas formosensis]